MMFKGSCPNCSRGGIPYHIYHGVGFLSSGSLLRCCYTGFSLCGILRVIAIVSNEMHVLCRLLTLARSFPTSSPFQAAQHNGHQPSLMGTIAQANSSGATSQIFATSANQDSNGANTSSTGHQADAVQGSSSAAGRLEDEACMQGIKFVQNLRNPSSLQPASLPLQLKLFVRIPVVVSARLFGQTGKPSETFAQLLVK